MNYYCRSLLLALPLTFMGTCALSPAKGAEFIPLEFNLDGSQPWLMPAGLSDNGATVFGVTGGDDETVIWTADNGLDNLTSSLRRETLASFPHLTRVSEDGMHLVGFDISSSSTAFHWNLDTGDAVSIGEDFRYVRADDISADGMTIAGVGREGDERYRPFIWKSDGEISWLGDEHVWDINSGWSVSRNLAERFLVPATLLSGNGQFVTASGLNHNLETSNEVPATLRRWNVASPADTEDIGPLAPMLLDGHRISDEPGGPTAISQDGSVIVGTGFGDSSDDRDEVFRWVDGTGMTGLGFEGIPYALSADGNIMAGGAAERGNRARFHVSVPNAKVNGDGFIWTVTNGHTLFPNALFADMSADGAVVVGGEEPQRAIVWDASHGKRQLSDVLIEEHELADEFDGWQLTAALQISDDGLTILGRGIDPSGDENAYWLVSLDEPLVPSLPGDFDRDGVLSESDIDLVSAAIQDGLNDARFDLNEDQLVDIQDHVFWVNELAKSFPGDANIDGKVEFPDFLALSSGFGDDGGWADGDFNASMTVDFADFLLLSENFGNSSEFTATVPEPEANWPWLFLVVALIRRQGRGRKHRCLPKCQTNSPGIADAHTECRARPLTSIRSLLLLLCGLPSSMLNAAEFIPVNFDLNEARPWLLPVGLSEDGTTAFGVTQETGDSPDRTMIWTQSNGTEDITPLLQRETLAAHPELEAISANGNYFVGSESTPVLFRWNLSTGESDSIGNGLQSAAARVISDDGQTIAGVGKEFDERTRPFIWTGDGGIQWLGDKYPWVDDTGWDYGYWSVLLSGDGQFVVATGQKYNPPTTVPASLHRWNVSSPSETEHLGNLSPRSAPGPVAIGQATAISHDGTVLTGYGFGESPGNKDVFRWVEGVGMDGLGFEGYPSAMSADGSTVVGGDIQYPSTFAVTHPSATLEGDGFIWTAESGHIAFPMTFFADISADGSLAVGGEEPEHAVIWDAVNGKRRLRDALMEDSDLATVLEDWQLQAALQISDDGLTILGRGIDPSDNENAYWIVSLDESLAGDVLGDFDLNRVLSPSDIDLLSAAIASGGSDATFDLNKDESVDIQDHAFWIDQLANTFPGDANLDGKVEFADFLALSAGFGSEGGWADGDFNASLTTDFEDFLLLSQNFGESGELAVTVPEPDAIWICLFLLPVYVANRRRNRA